MYVALWHMPDVLLLLDCMKIVQNRFWLVTRVLHTMFSRGLCDWVNCMLCAVGTDACATILACLPDTFSIASGIFMVNLHPLRATITNIEDSTPESVAVATCSTTCDQLNLHFPT